MTMLNLINVSAFFVLLIFFNGVSGLSEMEYSHFVVASNVINDTVNLSYTNRRLLGRVGRFAEKPENSDLLIASAKPENHILNIRFNEKQSGGRGVAKEWPNSEEIMSLLQSKFNNDRILWSTPSPGDGH